MIVKMDMNKEKWINEVMSSLDDVKPAEAPPFLYNKILGRISPEEINAAPLKLVWLAAASLVLLALLNFGIMRKTAYSGNKKNQLEKLADSYLLINENTLNYEH